MRVNAFGVVATVGLGFALIGPQLASADECGYFIGAIEGWGAQDINGDHFATIAEGTLDVDGDGWFGHEEMLALGQCAFINWKPVVNLDPNWVVDNSYCKSASNCFPANTKCVGKATGGDCWTE